MADPLSDNDHKARQSFLARQELLNTTKIAFQQLSGLLKNITLYPASHPYVLSLAEKMMTTMKKLFEGREEIAFYFLSGELFFETFSVPMDEHLASLMGIFDERDIGGMVFNPDITMEELINLAVLMNREPSFLRADGGIARELSRENITHLSLRRSAILVDRTLESHVEEGERKAVDLFQDAMEAIKEVITHAQLKKTIRVRKINMIVQAIAERLHFNRDSLLGLTGIKMNNRHAFTHPVNTAILAMALAQSLSLENQQIMTLGIAAMLHDIGKARVSGDITNKAELLNEEEWKMLERHPIEGAILLAETPGVSRIAIVTTFQHHQHGYNGYPQLEEPPAQHLFSQIISLVDAYEVLTAMRVYYHSPMPYDQVIRILNQRKGIDFSTALLKAFVKMIGIFPVGMLLKLSTGEVGLVLHQTSDLMRPRVLLLTKFDGSEKESGEEVDLGEIIDGKCRRDVIGTINLQEVNVNIKSYLT
jgi:HD-GYP domain-containing protein (c-di-GMP phosphodiesterase class II)